MLSPTYRAFQGNEYVSTHTTETTDLSYLSPIRDRCRSGPLSGLYGRSDAAGTPTGGFLLLLIAYLMLVFGNLFEGA